MKINATFRIPHEANNFPLSGPSRTTYLKLMTGLVPYDDDDDKPRLSTVFSLISSLLKKIIIYLKKKFADQLLVSRSFKMPAEKQPHIVFFNCKSRLITTKIQRQSGLAENPEVYGENLPSFCLSRISDVHIKIPNPPMLWVKSCHSLFFTQG